MMKYEKYVGHGVEARLTNKGLNNDVSEIVQGEVFLLESDDDEADKAVFLFHNNTSWCGGDADYSEEIGYIRNAHGYEYCWMINNHRFKGDFFCLEMWRIGSISPLKQIKKHLIA